jgi:hypothetical protein
MMKDSPATTWRTISLVLRWSSRTVEDLMCHMVRHFIRSPLRRSASPATAANRPTRRRWCSIPAGSRSPVGCCARWQWRPPGGTAGTDALPHIPSVRRPIQKPESTR